MNEIRRQRGVNLPAAVLRLVVNYIVIYDFCGSAADNNCAQNNVNKENNSRQWKPLSATIDKLCYFGIIPTRWCRWAWVLGRGVRG